MGHSIESFDDVQEKTVDGTTVFYTYNDQSLTALKRREIVEQFEQKKN